MGDRNQILFALPFADSFEPPFLEVGSRDYGNTATFRNIFKYGEGEYVGIDVANGKGVDRVVDLTADFKVVKAVLPEKFNTIICLSVLEHCHEPFKMAQNIDKLLNPGGRLYVSVPFSWKIHNYPADYWRFTPAGIRNLFPRIFFPEEQSGYHSSDPGLFYPGNEVPPKIEMYFAAARSRYGFYYAFWISLIRKLGIARPIFRHSYIFPPLQLEMIGQKKREP
jgi:SAM-dependent methyltransferase